MGTKTQAEFRNIVLGHLKVLSVGDPEPSAEDATTTNEVIDAVHAELQEMGLAYWELTAIPDAVIGGLKRVVAADLAHDFVTMQEANQYESKRSAGISKIREIAAKVKPTLPNVAEYF